MKRKWIFHATSFLLSFFIFFFKKEKQQKKKDGVENDKRWAKAGEGARKMKENSVSSTGLIFFHYLSCPDQSLPQLSLDWK